MDEWRAKIIVIIVILTVGMGISGFGHWKKMQAGEEAITAVKSAVAPLQQEVVVHISGAVVRPGVYSLTPGTRVAEAIQVAGGGTPLADMEKINLAQVVKDGQRVQIPASIATQSRLPQSQVESQAGTAMQQKISINTATASELDRLPGVGPSLAEQIVQYRQTKGSFRTLEELKLVPGIGEAKYQKLKEGISL